MVWAPDYLTVAEYNAWSRVADTVDDVEAGVWIKAASRAIDDHCHRQFGQYATAAARVYRRPPYYDPDMQLYCVDIDDLQDTTGVTIGGVVLATWITGGGVLLPDNAPGEGKPYTRIGLSSCPTMPLTIVAKWGWTTVPDQVKAAIRLQVLRFISRRDSPYGVAGSVTDGSELRLQARIDPDVAVALRGLGRQERPA